MRTYTSMAAGEAAKLLVTTAGSTRTVATVPDPQTAADLANALTALAHQLLVDAANPDLPAALRTLGVRQVEVQPEPGMLLLSPLATRPAPDFGPGTAWRSTGLETVWYLAHVLHQVDTLPTGPDRSVRHELGDLLALADGEVVPATVTSDGYDGTSLTLSVTSWLSAASDEAVEAVVGDDFGPGYGTDQIAYAFEDLTSHLMSNGFSVRVDPDAARTWLTRHRPHLLEE